MVGGVLWARRAIESLYEGACTVYVRQKSVDPDTGETTFAESAEILNEPCRLSFSSITAASGGHVAQVSQSVKLFIRPGLTIPAGSKIVVTQAGTTQGYKQSGEGARYVTHQEVPLELLEGRA